MFSAGLWLPQPPLPYSTRARVRLPSQAKRSHRERYVDHRRGRSRVEWRERRTFASSSRRVVQSRSESLRVIQSRPESPRVAQSHPESGGGICSCRTVLSSCSLDGCLRPPWPGNMQTGRPPGHQAATTLSRVRHPAFASSIGRIIAREYGCVAQNGSRA